MVQDQPPNDPVYLHSRREALIILLVWVASLLWTVPYCYYFGYSRPGEAFELSLVLGIPSWVFWGVIVPWGVSIGVSILMCVYVIQDDDLEPYIPPSEAGTGQALPDDSL